MRYQITCCSHRVSVAFALALAVITGPALAARPVPIIPADGVIRGPAHIIDGDTIDIAGTRIRLEGIDAPEAGQTCQNARGETWDCGHAATRLLETLTQNQQVDCQSRGLDKYGRLLGICFVGTLDLNAEMVKRGYAWAFVRYSKLYVTVEAEAKKLALGIWQGPATPAWDYRANKWTTLAVDAPQGCAIKGNVSRTGLIYHMPWSPWYEKVAMSPDRGTRWFCSESEAQAAGWRAAMTR
jgi:endonuclease YncB( thermonuclease family)